MKSLSVLVVDDDAPTQRVLQLWLQAHGHTVACASGGDEALAWLSKHSIDLVITDVLMPGGSGIDLISRIKAGHEKARVLAITGGGVEATSSTCLTRAHRAGADALLLKPFKQDQLATAMHYVLGVEDEFAPDVADRREVRPTRPRREIKLFAGLQNEPLGAGNVRSREVP